MFSGLRSDSTALSHVWLGLPGDYDYAFTLVASRKLEDRAQTDRVTNTIFLALFFTLDLDLDFYCLSHASCGHESSRVETFVVGAELGVQSRRRRTTVHDTTPTAAANTLQSWAGASTRQL